MQVRKSNQFSSANQNHEQLISSDNSIHNTPNKEVSKINEGRGLGLLESQKFHDQALNSGFSELDTQKLLHLVQKYTGNKSQTGDGNAKSYGMSGTNMNCKEMNNESQQSIYESLITPNKNLNSTENKQLKEKDLNASDAQNLQDRISQNQEERLKRLKDLKKKLSKEQQEENEEESIQNHESYQEEVSLTLEEQEEREKEQMLELMKLACQKEEDYESLKQQIEQTYLNQEVQRESKNEYSPEQYTVFNRLYSFAKQKQNTDATQLTKATEAQQQSFQKNSDEKQKKNIGETLFKESMERDQRLRAVQENYKRKVEEERKKSRVNLKSHQLAYKKLERDIEQSVHYVDYEENGQFNATQIGQLFYVLGIFKYLFNEEFEKKQKKYVEKYVIEPLSQGQIKTEERKLREEEFLMQVWLILNPQGYQTLDSNIVSEFVKLIYDPYVGSGNKQNQELILKDYLQAINHIIIEPIIEEENEYQSNLTSQEQNQNSLLWNAQDLLKSLAFLTDNFSSFKNKGSSGIKIPTFKERKGFFETYKECTFQPKINKKSQFLEKQHWANFFNDQHKKVLNQEQIGTSESRQSLAGKIINKKQLSSVNSDSYFQNVLEQQMQELKNNPLNLKVHPTKRVELLYEKNKIKEQKVRKLQEIKQNKEVQGCTFQPQINKNFQSDDNISFSSSQYKKVAHDRLWEISKVKKMNMHMLQRPSNKEIEEMNQCTFKPNTKLSNQLRRNKSPTQEGNDLVSTVRGFEENIERIKKGKQQQDFKKQQFEDLGKSTKYQGSTTKFKPFSFGNNQNSRLSSEPLLRETEAPIIDVEITIATGKTGHITIREGDDISKIAKSFCKTYSLNETTRKKLEGQLTEYIAERNRHVNSREEMEKPIKGEDCIFEEDEEDKNEIGEPDYAVVDFRESYDPYKDIENDRWNYQSKEMNESYS